MPNSTTLITALKFEGGVVIASDSQVSDPAARVRWSLAKIEQVPGHPMVVGFSGSLASACNMRDALEEEQFRANTFKSKGRLRKKIEKCVEPEYQRLNSKYPNSSHSGTIWDVAVQGLMVSWVENEPVILEIEPSGQVCPHDFFHAIGSGSQSAYVAWRTLGGRRLCELDRERSLAVTCRILRTCVDIELTGINAPYFLSVVTVDGVQNLSHEEIQPILQYVGEWEKREQDVLFSAQMGP